jgi:hypothetical protein
MAQMRYAKEAPEPRVARICFWRQRVGKVGNSTHLLYLPFFNRSFSSLRGSGRWRLDSGTRGADLDRE